MASKYISTLTVAGSDSSGGAGIQADIKTMSALGCYAASVIAGRAALSLQLVRGGRSCISRTPYMKISVLLASHLY